MFKWPKIILELGDQENKWKNYRKNFEMGIWNLIKKIFGRTSTKWKQKKAKKAQKK